jgi:hypothetical protein
MGANASSSRSKAKANKSSTLSSKAIVNKDRRCQRRQHKTQPKSHIKGKETTKAETITETKNRDSENNIASSTEKRRGMSPEIA